ncbi:MAG: tetratricopeptide repeat protein [Planctomycetes bacterium]|nr:tetratricopeptide repeat protein [Planctomycetota bacterium]
MNAPQGAARSELLHALRSENWSIDSFSKDLQGPLAQVTSRRELARQLHALRVAGTDPDPFLCGAASFVLGRFEDAARELRRAGGTESATYLRALALVRLDRGQEALPLLDQALKTWPGRKELAMAEIEALAQISDLDTLEDRLSRFEQDHPDDPDAAYLRGYAAERAGANDRAIEIYRSVLERAPTHARARFRLGFALDLRGDDDEAIEIYECLRDSQPTDPNAICNLGVLYEDRGEYEQAIQCFQWVLAADPYSPRAELYLKDARASLNMYFDEEQERLEDKFNQILRTPITDFELSVRSRNCLAKMQIESLGDLVQKTESELLSYKNFGETSLAEIKDILSSKGLHLGMSLGADEDSRLVREKAISIMFGLQKKAPPAGSLAATSPAAENLPEGDPEIYRKPVGDIAFSMRIRRALASLNINTLGELTHHTEDEFLAIKNFGQTSMEELKRVAAEFGIALRQA